MAGTAVVVKDGSLACSHQGKATIASVPARLTVGGKGAGVLLSGMEPGLDFAGCTNQTKPPPPKTPDPAPCISDAATAGAAGKLTVGGTAVLLASAAGPTHATAIPADPGTWSVEDAGQSKLTAV
jgi:hypothetical protein